MSDALSIPYIYGTTNPIPYSDEEIKRLQYVQSVDVMFMVHPNHPIATLSHRSAVDWRYEQPLFTGGPYIDQRIEELVTVLSVSGVTDSATLVSTGDSFVVGDVGRRVEYFTDGQAALGIITAYVSARKVTITPLEDRCLIMSKETYSPGTYVSWNSSSSLPTYGTVTAGTPRTVAFSNSAAVNRSMLGNYLRFVTKDGAYWWMSVTGVDDIVQQGAYGILAIGEVYNTLKPAFPTIRTDRSITGTLTSNTAGFFNLSTDVGRLFRLVLGDRVRHVRGLADAGNTTSAIKVSLDLSLPLTQEGAETKNKGSTNIWNRGAWFTGNYPGVVGFHEGRLCFGRTRLQPQSMWLSRSGDFYDFATTNEQLEVLADSALTLHLDSDTTNELHWMVSRGFLLLGSGGSEWQLGASTNRDALTALNATVQVQSNHGSQPIKALSVGRNVLYAQFGGTKLREMRYDYTNDVQASTDLNTYADHLLRDHAGVVQLAYQPTPVPTVYALLGDGQIGVLTYEPDQQVYAWSRYIVGGPAAAVTSIAVKSEASNYALYMTVRRTVDGVEQTSVEALFPEFRPTSGTDTGALMFLDRATRVPLGSVAGVVASGLEDFAGATVNALVDDRVYHGLAVALDGTLTLPVAPAARLYVGYGYTSVLKTFPVEVQGVAGTSQGKIMRMSALVFRLRQSSGLKHGPDLGNMREEDLRTDSDPVTAEAPFRSQDLRVTFDGNYETLGQYYVTQELSLPLNILAMFPEVAKFQ